MHRVTVILCLRQEEVKNRVYTFGTVMNFVNPMYGGGGGAVRPALLLFFALYLNYL